MSRAGSAVRAAVVGALVVATAVMSVQGHELKPPPPVKPSPVVISPPCPPEMAECWDPNG